MNNVAMTQNGLVVEPVGLSKVWSFRRRLRFPLEHVHGATVDPSVRAEPKGRRAPGLRLPGRLAGTFRHRGRKQFWNVSGYDQPVVVTLDAEEFDRLVITVHDPHQVADTINSALGARS